MREDLAFVALIATLGLEPLVSSNAQDDICLSPGPVPALLEPCCQTTHDLSCLVVVIVPLSWCAAQD